MKKEFNWGKILESHNLVVVDTSALWYSFREDMSGNEKKAYLDAGRVPDKHFQNFIAYLKRITELLNANPKMAVTSGSKKEFPSFRGSLENVVLGRALESSKRKKEQFHRAMGSLEKAVNESVISFSGPERADYIALSSYFAFMRHFGYDLTETDLANILTAINYNGSSALVTNDAEKVNAALFAQRCTRSQHFDKRFAKRSCAYRPTPFTVYSFSRDGKKGYVPQAVKRQVGKKRRRKGQLSWAQSPISDIDRTIIIEETKLRGWKAQPQEWGAYLVKPPYETLLTAAAEIRTDSGYHIALLDNQCRVVNTWEFSPSFNVADALHSLFGLIEPYMTGQTKDPTILRLHSEYEVPT